MTAKVIPIGGITKLDLPVETVLESAKKNLKSVVLIGWDNDNEMYFASTIADGGDILWLIEHAKLHLLESE